jgi:transposase-like protein
MDKGQEAPITDNPGDEARQAETGPDHGVRGEEPTGGQKGGKTQVAVRLASLPAEQLKSVLDAAIECYGNGASIYAIALDLGVEHTTLYRQLIKHREGEWRDAKESRALAELEEAEEQLKTASDGLALSRARERVRAAQWQLERLMRRIYGQEQQAGQGGKVSITLNIGGGETTKERVVSDQ